ncbi:LacI family DNA-binding transcriptional regulator [Microbacterium schleiferi]|uniref:LacI family DNA-binding transcriptional regulator n=1 Tax=Microbacterium schleiferi TaxID=69362 RepID=UPI002B4BD038|nr:LacI family DNA-binding transcriptional regulator [Microbacterium schleiferi]
MSERRATITDVAREAGVSPSTASVVFSGNAPASAETRRRVLAAAEALGYTGPDPRAASLRRGRSGIVGVVFGGSLRAAFHDPVTIAMMDGIAEGVAPLRAALLLLPDETSSPAPASAADDDSSVTGVATEVPSTMTSAPIDAAVLVGFGQTRQPSLDVLSARRVPVVIIEGMPAPTSRGSNSTTARPSTARPATCGSLDTSASRCSHSRSVPGARGDGSATPMPSRWM